jgi:general secretion pathway protein C
MVQHGPQLATVLLVCALAAEAGVIVTSPPVAVPAARAATMPNSLRRTGAAPVSSFDLPGIVNAHLFGRAADNNPDNAPQTAVSLVLSGVLAVSNPEQGMAILGPSTATAKLYVAGSALPGGVKLHAIYNDRVLLERDGALEALYLPKQSSSSNEPALQNATAQNSPVQRLQNIARGPNNQLLNGLIRVMPLQDLHNRGKLLGFRLYPGPGGAAGFARLGFLPGDEITAVNGTPLNDAESSNAVLQTLSTSATASVTIVRNGVAQEMNLNLDAVATEAESATQAASQAAPISDSPSQGRNFGGRFGVNRAPDAATPTPAIPPDADPGLQNRARAGAIPPQPDPTAAGPDP